MAIKTIVSALVFTTGLMAAGMAPQAHADRWGHCRSCGVVISVDRDYDRDGGHRSGAGTVLGAIVGGALGNQVGKGDGRKAATIGGAVIGGVVGHNVEKNRDRGRDVWIVEVRMDDGDTRSFEQSRYPDVRRGDHVQVSGNSVYRLR